MLNKLKKRKLLNLYDTVILGRKFSDSMTCEPTLERVLSVLGGLIHQYSISRSL